MAKKTQSDAERVEIRGHIVELRTTGDREELWIDGAKHAFFRVGKDYNLEYDAYSPPQPTLMEAAKAYVERLPDVSAA